MKIKGFTLIELLAVIVILAIIALIAIPIVLNIIGTSKKSSVLRSGELYLKGVETQIARKNLNESFNPKNCTIKSNGDLNCIDENNIQQDLLIETTGSKPIEGTLKLDDGKIIEVSKLKLDGYELEKKPDERLKIKGEIKDETPAEVKININKITTNSVTITVEAIDEDTGIKEYLYSIDGSSYKNGNNVKKIENLNSGENYTIYVKVINGSNLETIKTIEITTATMDKPTYEIDNSEWAKNKIVTINYPIIEGQTLTYEYSLDTGLSWQSATQIQEVTFTSNGTLIAKVTDGTNTTTSTFTIEKIDTTLPKIIEITGNTDIWTTSKTLVINAEDNESGIKEYSFDNGVTWQTNNTITITTNGTYNIMVKDNAENISENNQIIVNKISTTAPEITINKSVVGSNFITVAATIIDNEMGMNTIEYKIDNGNWIDGNRITTHTFNGLTKNSSHTIQARVTSKNGKSTISDIITINTSDITIPTYSVNKTGWANNKIVTINYPTINGQTLTYEYSLDKGSTWQSATQNQQVSFTAAGTVTARVTDGINTVTASTFTVDSIDTVNPIVKINSLNGGTSSITANVSVTETNLKTIKYYIKKSTDPDSSYELKYSGTNLSYTFTVTASDTMSIKVEAEDLAGNIGYAIGTAKTYQCFVAGTKILTKEGFKNIEDIKLGEKIYSINTENKLKELEEVTNLFVGETDETYKLTIGKEIVEVTAGHPFYIEGKEWTKVSALKEGDKVITSSNNSMEITKIEIIHHDNPIKIYNLTVSGHHNYLITKYELLVHNKLSTL